MKFKVIPVEDYGIVVNKTAKSRYVYHPVHSIAEGIRDIQQEKLFTFEDHVAKNWLPIIATIGRRIEDIPLIELPDEKQAWIRQTLRGINAPASDDALKIKLLEGLWEAANPNKYSEEELLLNFYVHLYYSNPDPEGSDHEKNRPIIQEYLKSLQKKSIPTEVELEMEGSIQRVGGTREEGYAGGQAEEMVYAVKITNKETNIITALNYKQ